MDFSFDEDTSLIRRINALVGKNGTGKTQLLAALSRALSGLEVENAGRLDPMPPDIGPVLAVSYSAFDTFTRPRTKKGARGLTGIYHYCGLRDREDRIDLQIAFDDFQRALRVIEGQHRQEEWAELMRASGLLEVEHHLEPLVTDEAAFQESVRQLSAGHKLIVFVLANLLAHIDYRAVILFDEPELHLHPNMLSALMRAMHRLLDDFSAFAVVATHSPIVIQEIPAARVRILEREGRLPRVRRYPGESFGASLNEIVRIAFATDEEQRNYVHLLQDMATAKNMSSDAIAELLDEDLPLGVLLFLKSLVAEHKNEAD